MGQFALVQFGQRCQPIRLKRLGQRESQRELQPIGRRRPASVKIRCAIACANSTYASSFIVTNDCSGVLVRIRRTVQISRLGASKVAIDGYGTVRRKNV